MTKHDPRKQADTGAEGGARVFLFVWFGQLISLLGSGLTSFALSLWAYQRSGATSQLALVIACFAVPGIVVAPLAGALVDRCDRRRVMAWSAATAGLCTAALSALFFFGRLELWEICLGVAGISISGAFQWPAYTAATTVLLSKEQLARATGMMQIAQALALIVCPPLAVALLPRIRLQGILLLDFLSYCFIIAVLMRVRIARPESTNEGKESKGSLWFEVISGWKYIRTRRGLLVLLGFVALMLFATSMTQILIMPLVLGVASPRVMAALISVCSAGMLIGGILMATWGGPRLHVRGVVGAGVIMGLALILAGISTSPLLIAVGLFALATAAPIGIGCNQVVWQSRVPQDVQGRVFALRKMVSDACLPLAALLAGPLVDRVFGPLLLPGGSLSHTVGQFVGIGPGRGTGLLLAILGVLTLTTSVSAIFARSPGALETGALPALGDANSARSIQDAFNTADPYLECKTDSMIEIAGGTQ